MSGPGLYWPFRPLQSNNGNIQTRDHTAAVLVMLSHLSNGIPVSVSTSPETTRVKTASQTRLENNNTRLSYLLWEPHGGVQTDWMSQPGDLTNTTLCNLIVIFFLVPPCLTSPYPAQWTVGPFETIILCTWIRLASCVFLKISCSRLRQQNFRHCTDF